MLHHFLKLIKSNLLEPTSFYVELLARSFARTVVDSKCVVQEIVNTYFY